MLRASHSAAIQLTDTPAFIHSKSFAPATSPSSSEFCFSLMSAPPSRRGLALFFSEVPSKTAQKVPVYCIIFPVFPIFIRSLQRHFSSESRTRRIPRRSVRSRQTLLFSAETSGRTGPPDHNRHPSRWIGVAGPAYAVYFSRHPALIRIRF